MRILTSHKFRRVSNLRVTPDNNQINTEATFNYYTCSPVIMGTFNTNLTTSLLIYYSIISLIFNSFISVTQQQSSISLSTAQWFVSNSNNSIVVPAQVPGGIYSDLRRNNVLKQDILFGKNDIAYRWVGNENWTYTTTFSIDHNIARSQSVKLILHGIDTIATLFLNGHEIGSTDNMFVRYKFDVKPHLKLAGLPNTLIIKFFSPIKYSAKRSHQSIRNNRGKIIPPYCPSPAQRGECHVNFIRKMQASFSWDWGPAFPSVGLYKDVTIEYGSFGMIRDIMVETRRVPPLISQHRETTPPPQIIISSSIRQQVKIPYQNKTVPYIRAPPFYMAINDDTRHLAMDRSQTIDITSSSTNFDGPDDMQRLLEENWTLKITLVAEMVQPSFGYNLRVEFNLNNALHYESEHINVVANSDGIIRLGFNLRVDTTRMRIKPWWPNNAGSQTLYKLSARVMPIPNPTASIQPPDHIRLHTTPDARKRRLHDGSVVSGAYEPMDDPLDVRKKPLQSSGSNPTIALLGIGPQIETDSSYQIQYISEKDIYFGFRTVELIQEPVTKGNLEDGSTFNFRINGVDLFAMGSNWIPANVLPEYSNDLEYIRYLLQSAKDANMNMLRVWGGGIYESDEFYKMADEMGIMIWHDFMFACALYPTEDDFLASVRMEVEQQVQRLQYHPSIILWAGNNENEMAIAGPWWPEVLVWSKNLRQAYAKLYVETIKPIVQILDPTRPYVESSPSNGLLSKTQPNAIARVPNDNKYGDVHHYDYLSNSFDWTNYPSTRFASEYGFQSYPSFNALTSISTPNDWKFPITSNILHRQHRMTGEVEMKLQIKMHFHDIEAGGADKLKNYLYISQLTQAIAIKTETEFYRRNRFIDPETKLGRTMGALYWQLNDVWQAPTWSSIEYGGKWKILHYFARRFFFPIQVIPYLVQPPSPVATYLQQMVSFGSGFVSNSYNNKQAQQSNDDQQNQQEQQERSPASPLFVVDLVRDDLFYLLDAFNVTIRFYRWTSFAPVWQDTVYVKNTRPQNVTRIYEQDLNRIIRQPGVVSLSAGVFQVIIEQQPRMGLSQIDNYLMPVAPTKITAMRVARITIELVQGPFELSDVSPDHAASSQWSCAYRLTLVSDSIAMFVWLDLNLLNIVDVQQNDHESQTSGSNRQPPLAPENIHLDAIPGVDLALSNKPPEHIRLHGSGIGSISRDDSDLTNAGRAVRRARLSMEQPIRVNFKVNRQNPKNVSANHFKPLEGSGSDMLRYQFNDNGFNMFEPSKMIDLYLNRCLSKAQIEAALEIQSLANSL